MQRNILCISRIDLPGSPDVVVVPSLKVNEVCKMFHSGPVGAHMGITATQRKIERRFWWPGMLKEIADFIRCFYYCQTSKPTQFSV